MRWVARSVPSASVIANTMLRTIATRCPSLFLAMALFLMVTLPSKFDSTNDCSLICAAPPMWNVRIVSCVPGSPIDWAAMTPTARSEERRVGKGVDLGGRRIIKKKKKKKGTGRQEDKVEESTHMSHRHEMRAQ